jgi:predicted RNase H-like HicB family nuclease
MQEYIVQEPARAEDGTFIVTLTSEEGHVLAQGVGESFEEALEQAKSRL